MNTNTAKRVLQRITFPALAVGTLFTGKRYYDNYTIENSNTKTENLINMYSNYFTIDRLIDADCQGKVLSVGVINNVNSNSILNYQGIRWGEDGQIKRLISSVKINNGLIYIFEDNYTLTLNRNDKNKIIYSFHTENDVIVKELDDKVVKYWKRISLNSSELDRIAELK
jgi:hypothetical protein